ncbi:MAG: flagellar assembly protein FliX [Bdellovibrionales bacterium]
MISRIEGPGSTRSTSPIRRTSKSGKTSSASFSKHLEETDESSGIHGTSALGGVSGVLDLQEVDDALARAAKGKLRAEDILDKLDELKLDLLSGAVSKTKLQRLSQLVQSHRQDVSDPKLNEILDEIDLRAQVELAKFTRA